MKKIINKPTDVVSELLRGMEKAYPSLKYIEKLEVITRREKSDKVAVISGGGAGHEPAHAGYVGKGMLDAAISGNVFSSPSPDRIIEGINQTNSGKGVLMIIKNYSGDIMNFGLSKDMAEMDDIEVETVVVKDDVAVPDSTYSTGRRGIAGTVFVHKIAGAKAETGATLEEVKETAQKVIDNVRSMGMALTPCIVPAAGKANFTLGENEMEIGMGIHGEPGTHKDTLKTADEVTEHLVGKILEDLKLKDGEEVAVMVNGLASTPLMELYIVNKKVNEILWEKGIKVYKTMVGEFMTSLEMAGCSVSILKLDKELKTLLDATADTPAFKSL